MATDRMFDLAFQFAKTKLWKKLKPFDVFSVELPGDEIGYCCLVNYRKSSPSLYVFLGDNGYFHYFQTFFSASEEGYETDEPVSSDVLDCLLCKNNLSLKKEITNEVDNYMNKYNNGAKTKIVPVFLKQNPEGKQTFIKQGLEEQQICTALSAAITLSNELKKHSKKELGFLQSKFFLSKELYVRITQIPNMYYVDNTWRFRITEPPKREIISFAALPFQNEIVAKKIRNMKKKENWECRMVLLTEPIPQEENKKTYYLPLIFYIVDRDKKEMLMPVFQHKPGMEDPEFLEEIGNRLLDGCPKTIYVKDKGTRNFLKDLCEKTGIELNLVSELVMDDMVKEIQKNYMYFPSDDNDDYEEALRLAVGRKFLTEAEDKDILKMSDIMTDDICFMFDSGLLPTDVSKKIHRLLPDL